MAEAEEGGRKASGVGGEGGGPGRLGEEEEGVGLREGAVEEDVGVELREGPTDEGEERRWEQGADPWAC